MSHVATHGAHDHHAHVDKARILRPDNVSFALGSGGIGFGLLGIGGLFAAGAIGLGFAGAMGATVRSGLAAVHIGAMACLAICLTALLFTMIFNLLNAGWTSTLRRQFENLGSLAPLVFLVVVAVAILDMVGGGKLYPFLNPANHSDHFLEKKWGFFFGPQAHSEGGHFVFPAFWIARAFVYLLLWWYLSSRMLGLSRRQDESGDPALSAQARKTSAWGVPLLALSIAFAGFDYLMSLDFRYFSTMWGVYFFAGGSFAMFATVSLIFAFLRSKGKLEGAVTSEHFHDLGKLLFSFTVFWAYIAFSQYFLTWYSNIPEETGFFIYRTIGVWKPLGVFLIIGHFVIPFLFLLSRHVKRNPALLSLGAAWALLAHLADVYWMVRPMVSALEGGKEPLGGGAIVGDLLGIFGVALMFAGLVVTKVASAPLMALKEPYLAEGLEHTNYV